MEINNEALIYAKVKPFWLIQKAQESELVLGLKMSDWCISNQISQMPYATKYNFKAIIYHHIQKAKKQLIPVQVCR